MAPKKAPAKKAVKPADESVDTTAQASASTGSDQQSAEAVTAPVKASGSKFKAVNVQKHDGNFAIVDPATRRYVRSYSEDVHGEDFKGLVDSLLEGHPNFIAIDEADIKKVQVIFHVMNKATGLNDLVTETFTDLEAALARSVEVKDAVVEVL